MDLILGLIALVISLLLSYFIIKGAVLAALKEHTRWQVGNRWEIEAKYGKPKL